MPFFATDSTFPDYDFEDERDRKQPVNTMSYYETPISPNGEYEVLDDEKWEFVKVKIHATPPVHNPLCHQGSFAEAERQWMAQCDTNQ